MITPQIFKVCSLYTLYKLIKPHKNPQSIKIKYAAKKGTPREKE
jgi:hypothetical protein